MNIILPKYVIKAIQTVHTNGFEAYIVGGCVRDYLLNKTPKDIDITTNANPKDIEKIFKNHKTILTGAKHGTVIVIFENNQIEITTYRIDGNYSDNRRPDYVEFSSKLIDDISRRDFTINAIAYSKKNGIIDYFNGINDIKNGIIRSVLDADKRFKEDSLRILRGLRFASEIGFFIEKNTHDAMHANKNLLKNISEERIVIEFTKLLFGKNVAKVFIENIDIIEIFIPELKHSKSLQKTAFLLENTENIAYLKWTALMFYISENQALNISDITQKAMKNLKIDNFTINRTALIVKYKNLEIIPQKTSIKKIISKLGYEIFKEVILFKKLDLLSENSNIDEINEIIYLSEKLIREKSCVCIKDLNINGDDLLQLGAKNGKNIGDMLKKILELVINEEIENDKQLLIKIAQKHIKATKDKL